MSKLLHALGTLAAGAWLGAIILIAIVAQTTFATTRALGVAHPDALAGRIMAKNFARHDIFQGVCAAVLVGTQILAPLIRWRFTVRDRLRLCAILGAGVLYLYSAFVLTPRITQMQGSFDASASDAPIKAMFDDFHKSAVLLAKINLALLTLITLEMAWPRRDESGDGPLSPINMLTSLQGAGA